ncbi:MAG: hypothetical protein U0992_23250 [Planctomycetaceae bacterium]
MSVVPHRFLFRAEFSVPRIASLPRRKGLRILDLPATCVLPDLGALDADPPFYTLRAAWNAQGLGFELDVRGKRRLPKGDIANPTAADGLQVWIDTRSTQNVHRATRFCHSFCFVPGSGKQDPPAGVQTPVARAREDAPLCDPENLLIAADMSKDGYRLEAWLPADVLHGFDPEAQPRLGFCYLVRDFELGIHGLSVEGDFPYESDPSLWSVLRLMP